MPIVGVVADANVLLSAVVGKAALRVFSDSNVAVHAAKFNASEVTEYLPLMAAKYNLPLKLVEMQWKVLKIQLHPVDHYARWMTWAHGKVAERDPDDAHPLALARALDLPLWSNDKDLGTHGVVAYPTARLLKLLF